MCESKQKRIVAALDLVLVCGLLTYSIILFIINKTLNPMEILGSNYEAINLRLRWRYIAEAICSLSSLVYIIGHILVIYSAIREKLPISFKTIFLYFLGQICIMFVCTMPFAFFDLDYLGDYIFPIWGIAGTLILLLIIFFLVGICNQNKSKR